MPASASDRPLRRALERSRRVVLNSPLLTVCALLFLTSLLFLVAPRLDLVVSRLFYDPAGRFDGSGSAPLDFVRELGRVAEWAVALAFAAPLAVKILAPESRLLVRPRVSLFMLGTLALGPGLVVNGILKEFWGRARPRELLEYGGDAVFSPIWWFSDQCEGNCSFVSGEASSAFWLVALAFVAPKVWRLRVALATFLFAAAVSFTRIAVGGHFLSDVLLAWLLTLLIIVAVHRLVIDGLPERFDTAVERALARGGRSIRQRLAARADPPTA